MNGEQQRFIETLKQKREAFEAKMRFLYNETRNPHSHAEISEWIKCFPCMMARKRQIESRATLGLSNPRSYMRWRKQNTDDFENRLRRAQENEYKMNRMPKWRVNL